MAIYTTFFLCKPEELPAGFPGWRPPLPQPVRRKVKNPFTNELLTIETREPEWPDAEDDALDRDYQVIAGKGSYEDYLEGRLPPFVRVRPHWAAKGLTDLELNPLAKAIGVGSTLECPLYSPPASGAMLHQLPSDMVSQLRALDQRELDAVASRWAARMSTPDYTQSVTGVKLSDGWAASDAMEILKPIAALASQAKDDHGVYLLIEV
jgi:hypothetical protein